MRAERSGEYHEPEPHLIPLALRASAGFGPDRQVYGTDYPIPDTHPHSRIRDYTNVVDLAEAHVKALQHLLAENPAVTVNPGMGRVLP
jgi:UDP-arabinose 4-epimerase